MTQEEKDLLLKDLCARLPYIPIIQIEEHDWNNLHIDAYDTPFRSYYLEPFIIGEIEIKPYLRPMSSMTEEEFEKLKEYSGLVYDQLDLASFQDGAYKCLDFYLNEVPADVVILVFDWLNAYHFDYRGLIERGLALEAPEGMYEV